MLSTTMTTKGQVTIPHDIRRALGIVPGDRVLFTHTQEGSVAVTVVPVNIAVTLFGSLSSHVHGTDYKKARNASARIMAKKYLVP